MTSSFFPCRGLQGDSLKTWHFHSFPAGVTGWFPLSMTFSFFPCTGWYRVIPTKHDIFILSLHRLIQGDSQKTWNFHSFPSQVDTGWFQQNMTFSCFPYRWKQGNSYRTWHFHFFPAQVVTGWFLQNITFSFFPVGGYIVIPKNM